jgi:hypothetical protein
MQHPTDAPRSHLTVDQVVSLIQDSSTLTVDKGLELVNQALEVELDISPDLVGGSISRDSYADLHASATFELSADLDWQTAIIRPYMILSNGVLEARFNLGAFYTSTPKQSVKTAPRVHEVTGYDILHRLHDTVGDAYSVAQGAFYLAAVEEILQAQGFTKYIIDQRDAATALPSAKTWALDENIKWITVVNDLLAAIGYQGIWSDWNGYLRVQPYITPRDRAAEWAYRADDPAVSMLTSDRAVIRDYYESPNRWVAVVSNSWSTTDAEGNEVEITPTENNGIWTYVNQTTGPTSVEAREGRTITRMLSIEAADQASLIAAAQVSIDADLRLSTTYEMGTAPNPLHWHFDRVILHDPELAELRDVMVTSWTLDLDGGDMSQRWTEI